ncbi:uncharacterized protein LOC110464991 [Mizuhopecten yessoensis]|uniref:uncharacterized protein LOC110464991 n=1 Tax=Mizuhopecten yessoensis TaxID=6573 RepID=UPI000B45E5FD|nr:uncharacterized protein LOC110464991 [Mizuhopecten yessoensis]
MAQAAVKEAPFQNSLRRMLNDDDKNCQLLVAAYKEAATCAQKNILVEDHVLEFDPNFFNKVEKGIADLNKVDRQILVIGESSAGKSSFLNLLLERKVLPQRAAPCTRCFCCIKKGPNLEAHITSFGCSTPSKIINGNDMTDEEFRDELEGLMNADNCLQALDRCIDVFVPSNILQDKVYLVDSAGFGESEQITRSLVKYLPKAIGIIFILNSTVGLGISEDRGALILDEIKLLAKKGDIPSFDPRQVVFIANKWDQIDKTERKDHQKKMIKKLETSWPNFQEDQLLPLSVNYVS